jgi:hypothetical protein
MTRQRASCFIAVFSLLACISAIASPRTGNPCKQMQHTLDRQIDDLKTQQKTELLQCEQGNGRGSAACLSLKDQQKQSLRAMRVGRTGQMNDCYGRQSLGAATRTKLTTITPIIIIQTTTSTRTTTITPIKYAIPIPDIRVTRQFPQMETSQLQVTSRPRASTAPATRTCTRPPAPAVAAQLRRQVTTPTVAAARMAADPVLHMPPVAVALAVGDPIVGLHIHPEAAPLRTRAVHLDHPDRHIPPAAVEVPTLEDPLPPGRLPPLLLPPRPAAGPNRDHFFKPSSGRHFRLLELFV